MFSIINFLISALALASDLARDSGRHVKMSFIFGKRYFTFPVSQKGQISFPFPLWQKGQLYFSRYFSCTIFHKKSTGFGLKSVEVLVLKKSSYLWLNDLAIFQNLLAQIVSDHAKIVKLCKK